MIQRLWIDGCLPSLNEYIDECRSHPKKGGAFKKTWQNYVRQHIRSVKIRPVLQARFNFVWIEKNKRRDKDNISSFGRKIILDALVEENIIANDGWNHVVNWTDHFYVFDKDKKNKPGILVLIEDLSDKEIGEDKRGEEWLKTS